jgi:hypothetical protein
MKKTRKFGDGGETEDLVAPESREAILDRVKSRLPKTLGEPYTPEPEEPSRAFAKPDRFSSAKPKVVTKEELAKSGLSLRDYMNKQQGLKKRGVNPTLGEARNSAEQSAADAIDPGDIRTREMGRTRGGPSYDSAGKPSNARPDVLSSNYSRNTRTGATAKMASGGSVSSRADGIAQRGKTRGRMC